MSDVSPTVRTNPKQPVSVQSIVILRHWSPVGADGFCIINIQSRFVFGSASHTHSTSHHLSASLYLLLKILKKSLTAAINYSHWSN